MTRLYLRLFLAFWLVVILTISAVLLVNTQLERLQQDERAESQRAEQTRMALVTAAQTALQRDGEAGLVRWLERTERRFRRLGVFVIDAQGRELRDRQPPRPARGLWQRWQRGATLPERPRRGAFAHALAHEGRDYLLIVSIEPPPALLRVLGPAGPLGLLLLAIAISGLVCLWLARQLSRPIRELRIAGRALGQGRLDTRVPPAYARRRDELGDLARDFNSMAERIAGLLASQRQLLRDVSHELRSPLARIQVAMTLARDATAPDRRDHYLERIETEMERLNELIGQILVYSRLIDESAPRPETIDLTELLEHISGAAALEGEGRGVAVLLHADPGLRVQAEPELLHSAVENVVRNAIRHAPQDSTVEIECRRREEESGCEISVRDEGPGVPEDMLERMFEPFVRLSSERGEASPGGGVGLAITRRAIGRHGGRVIARNRLAGGLEVVLILPPATLHNS